MANQVGRAYRGTFGAATGLKTIVASVARQMMRAGSSAEETARLLERGVLDHPERNAAGATDASENQARLMVELTHQCVAEVKLEMSAAATLVSTESRS